MIVSSVRSYVGITTDFEFYGRIQIKESKIQKPDSNSEVRKQIQPYASRPLERKHGGGCSNNWCWCSFRVDDNLIGVSNILCLWSMSYSVTALLYSYFLRHGSKLVVVATH